MKKIKEEHVGDFIVITYEYSLLLDVFFLFMATFSQFFDIFVCFFKNEPKNGGLIYKFDKTNIEHCIKCSKLCFYISVALFCICLILYLMFFLIWEIFILIPYLFKQ